MEKVSIIVPLYNAQSYLKPCLDSIINQSYKKIEILLINDGSKDQTDIICREYCLKDNRIKYFKNENHGVSYSRNFGIQKSTGSFLSFVDGDDILSENFIEVLVKNMNQTEAECSICKIESFYENLPSCDSIQGTCAVQDSNVEDLFIQYGGFLANKLYKKSIILKYHLTLDLTIHICEDLLFNINYFSHIHKIVYDTSTRYYYRQHALSAFHDFQNEKWFSVLDSYQVIYEKVKKDSVCTFVLYTYCLLILEALYRLKYIDNESLKKKVLSFKKKYITLESYKKFHFKQKIKFILFIYFPSVMMYRKRKNLK